MASGAKAIQRPIPALTAMSSTTREQGKRYFNNIFFLPYLSFLKKFTKEIR